MLVVGNSDNYAPLEGLRGHGKQPVYHVAGYTGSRELVFITAGDLFGFGAVPALVDVNFHQLGDVRVRIANYPDTDRLLLQYENIIYDLHGPRTGEPRDEPVYLCLPSFGLAPSFDKPGFLREALYNALSKAVAGKR